MNEEARKAFLRRISNGRHQIDRALDEWEGQARDAADAWDGHGVAPFIRAMVIRAMVICDLIDECAENLARETALRLREGN